MPRSLAFALILAAVAAGQGVDDWIEAALDPRTAPEQRVDALKRIAQTKEHLDRLAERGLDPARDPEVVHAVVDTLLRSSPDYRPHLERMCRLLLAERHAEKVLTRFQAVGEHPERGQALLDGCGALARESADPQLRLAAVRALARIPRRRASEIIVEAALASDDEAVKAAAREYTARWFGRATLREAADYLQAHRLDSFWDLVQRRVDELRSQEEGYRRLMRDYLAKAPAEEALKVLEEGGANRVFAAQRLRTLAEQNGLSKPTEFARRAFDALGAELGRDPVDAGAMAHLVAALQCFARDPSGPLWQVRKPKELRDLLQRIAAVRGSPADLQQLGANAVRFLGTAAVEDDGGALKVFAEGFPSVDVRKEAIQQLSTLALRVPERSNYVGIILATILPREKEAAIRAQILSVLTQNHIPIAREPNVVATVRGYLEPGAASDLTDAELRDCAIVLGKSRAAEARDALKKCATSHPNLKVRRFAVEEGLLPWARQEEAIHADLKALILARDQPVEARKAVIEALGRRGGRRSAQTLKEVEESPDLDPALLSAVRDARLQLGERLAGGEGSAEVPEQKGADLAAAGRILEEEIAGDPERLERLADAIVRAADLARLPAATARYRRAWLYARRLGGDAEASELLDRYEDAAASAASDGLPPALRRAMLVDYRDMLLGRNDFERAVTCSADLAEVALAEKDLPRAAQAYLDAAEIALKLGDASQAAALAGEMLDRAAATGGVAGELLAREQGLRGEVGRLPRPG